MISENLRDRRENKTRIDTEKHREAQRITELNAIDRHV